MNELHQFRERQGAPPEQREYWNVFKQQCNQFEITKVRPYYYYEYGCELGPDPETGWWGEA